MSKITLSGNTQNFHPAVIITKNRNKNSTRKYILVRIKKYQTY